jgi:xylulokinase
MDCYLGIDLGTSSVKVAALDANGAILAVEGEPYPILHPFPDASEQDPEQWWAAIRACTTRLLTKIAHRAPTIRSIGLSGQMHGLVLLDRNKQVLRNAIIWPDRRSAAECAEWTAEGVPDEYAPVTGIPLATGFMAPSLEWVRRQEPVLYDRARWALLPKDYIRYRLIGEIATEATDATATYLFDVTQRMWSDAVINRLQFRQELFPPLIDSLAPAGRLLPEVAAELDLPSGVPVVAGGSDQAMAALALNAEQQGTVITALSTGGTVTATVHRPITDKRIHTFCHLDDRTWLTMGATLSAGASLSWFQRILSAGCRLAGGTDSIRLTNPVNPEVELDALSKAAEGVPPGANGLFFLPYLNGDRTPHMNPHARGSFIGLNHAHTAADLARAVMEGVVYSMYESFSIMAEYDISIDRIVAYAGGSRSALWRQILADVVGKPVDRYPSADVSALGAARAAAIGVGTDLPAFQEQNRNLVRTEPDPSRHRQYQRRVEVFRGMYGHMEAVFNEISEL